MQQLLFSLYFKKHDRHSYLFSVYLPTRQCLFPRTHARAFTFTSERKSKQKVNNSRSNGFTFQYLLVIRSQQLFSSTVSFSILIESFITTKVFVFSLSLSLPLLPSTRRRKNEPRRIEEKKGKVALSSLVHFLS